MYELRLGWIVGLICERVRRLLVVVRMGGVHLDRLHLGIVLGVVVFIRSHGRQVGGEHILKRETSLIT